MKQEINACASNILVDYCRWALVALLGTGCGLAQTVLSPQPGMLANTMTAPPLSVNEKFHDRLQRGLLLRGSIGSVLAAAFAQGIDTPGEWGGGVEAYAKRYGSSIGSDAARQATTFLFEAMTHQDPRYFPSTEKSFKARARNALLQTFIAKNDRGEPTIAYSKIIGAIAAGQVSNAWLPDSQNGIGHGFQRTGLILAGDAGVNFLSELVPALRARIFRKQKP